MVMADGFAWNGQTYDSLSKVAFAITGTRWNGPRFFGLRDKDDRSTTCPPTTPNFRVQNAVELRAQARPPGTEFLLAAGNLTGTCGEVLTTRGAPSGEAGRVNSHLLASGLWSRSRFLAPAETAFFRSQTVLTV
jgi:Protein of unknown function (DUF2924)